MTQTTQRPNRVGDRLPRAGSAAANRGKEIRLGLLGVLGIGVLLVGVPAALSIYVGYPLPRSAPSRDWLTQSVTATLIIKILACIVWVLWAHFAVCVIAEWRALRRGRLPGDVPFGGGSQMLARRLVASALLLAGAATAFGNLSSGSNSPAPSTSNRVVASASAHPGSAARAGSPQTGVANRSPEHQGATRSVAEHEAGATAKGATKSYTVAPPHGRHYDSLWDIAHRTLGDPLRYKEIYALNKDRVQPDGRKLVDANLIRPGWQLRLPSDARGPGVHVANVRNAPPAVDEPAGETPAPVTSAQPAAHGSSHTLAADPATHGGAFATATRAATPGGSAGNSADLQLLGGGLMLAGIALALSARRGPYGKVTDDELAISAAADIGLAASLDRALRNLAAARKDQELDLPQPVLAWASADEVSLALAGGDTSDPPAPWRAAEDSTWICRLAELSDHPRLAETAAPFPGLLCVGRDDGHEVFVDFEQAPGLISIGGDSERGRDLVTSLAAQAVTCPWSDGAKATLVGFSDGEQLAAMDTHSVDHFASLAGVLDDLERRQADLARLQRSLGVDGVLSGRQSRRSGAWAPHLIVMSGAPTADETRRLAQLVGDGRSQFVVLVVGDLVHAAWRFVIDGQRHLDLGVLGASVQANQLDRNSMLQLIDTLRAAGSAAEQDGKVASFAPQSALASTVGEQTSSGGTWAAVRAHRPAAGQVSAAVCLLGPVTVEADGPVDPAKRELLTEIIVAVALAPDGISPAVLRAAIWPRGVSNDVFEAAMQDAVAWLGRDGAGRPALEELDGRWLLGPRVWIDWENLQVATRAAQGVGELDALRYCISLFRGEAFSGTPVRRYDWLSFHRCARAAAVVATSVVRRAAELLAGQDKAGEAEEVLRRGLVLVPTAEPMWRDLLALAARRGPDAAASVADEMYGELRARRVWAQPETDALVSQLAPGRREADTA